MSTPPPINPMEGFSNMKPYVIRMFHEWLGDNNLTPHISVNLAWPGIDIPPHLRGAPTVTLNLNYRAVSHLVMGNEAVTFMARFKGASYNLVIPVASILGIFAKENMIGAVFVEAQQVTEGVAPVVPVEEVKSPPDKPARPNFLKVVK
jgi:stringent starvation protein B